MPVLASVPFGMGTYFIFMSSFTYIVVAYWLLTASTLACNTTMRMAFAAVFLLFARRVVPCSQHCRRDAALGWADDYYDPLPMCICIMILCSPLPPLPPLLLPTTIITPTAAFKRELSIVPLTL